VRLLNCAIGGLLVLSASQAFAQEDASSEIRSLKAKLKELERRVDVQIKGEQTGCGASKRRGAGSLQGAADRVLSMSAGKLCYKGVHADLRRLVDLTGIYRSRNLASDTGSVYNFMSLSAEQEFQHRRGALLGPSKPSSRCWRKAMPARNAPFRLRRNRLRGCCAKPRFGGDQFLHPRMRR